MKQLLRLLPAVVLAVVALPAAATTIIITTIVWSMHHPMGSEVPNFSDADFAAAQAVNPQSLAQGIEVATDRLFRVAGPVTVTTGKLSPGDVALSVPVSFAEVAQSDEDVKIGPYLLLKGTPLHKQIFVGTMNGRPAGIATWCGPLQVAGLFGKTDVQACIAERKDGHTSVFLGMVGEGGARWMATAIDMADRGSENAIFPKLSSVAAPQADMTLEMVVFNNKAVGAYWRLRQEKRKEWLFGDEENPIFGPDMGMMQGAYYVYPLGNKTLAFAFDRAAKQVTPLGVVTLGH